MPLYEFLRLAMEKLESSQQKPCSINPSLETENDLVGGATIKRASRSPDALHIDSTLGNSVTEKCGGVEHISNDISPALPTFSWLSKTADDHSSAVLRVHDKKVSDGDRFPSLMQQKIFPDNEESECLCDGLQNAKKLRQDQECHVSKKRRVAEVHNLSERRRRDRINQKMQALQELIPNCNKADKASMLDEVIEYLKTLKHQVQILSTGSGLCVPPYMLGAQHMYYPPIPHFSYMGVRMGSCTSFGYIDAGSPRCPVFPTTAGPFIPIYGHLPLTGWRMRPTACPKLNHEDVIVNKKSQSVLCLEESRPNQLQSTTGIANQDHRVKGHNRTEYVVRASQSS